MSTLGALPLLGSVFLALQLQAVQVRIACIGDSITEQGSVSNPSVESYPAKLQRLFGTNDYTVHNYGISARTLLKKGDYPYWNENYFKPSHDWQPDIVIIQLGTNDSKPYNWKYGTNFVSDYEELVASYANLTNAPRVIVCTPCPVYNTNKFSISPSTVATNIAPLIRDLAGRLGLELVDLHTRLAGHPEWFPDAVHPNSKGMTVMAAVMYSTLAEAFSVDRPSLDIQRLSSVNRMALSWPAASRGMVPLYASTLTGSNVVWSVAEPVIYLNGGAVRQTNTIIGSTRFYRLWQP
jgi:lysophospholipase L1-like esterase